MDTSDWPKPSIEELPGMYEDIDEMVQIAEAELPKHFPVEEVDGTEHVIFEDATPRDYVECMDSARDTMVPFFQKVTGLPDREIDRQYGIADVGQRLRSLKSSLHEYDDAVQFGEVLHEVMPASLPLHTCLYTFYRVWEADQRRFYRMKYEEEVRDFLTENGFSNFKGNSLPGEPDFVVPKTEPYEVFGEVRVIQRKDKEKRFKEFRQEASECKDNFGEDALFVAVANMGAQYLKERDRDDVRAEITKNGNSNIDLVVFHDEFEEMLDQFEDWDVTGSRQQTLG